MPFAGAAARCISDILLRVKKALLLGSLILCAFFCARAGVDAQQQQFSLQIQQNPPAQKPPVQNPQTLPPQNGATNPQQAPTITQQLPAQQQAPVETLHTVVIDPGHGGTDTGSRGSTGIAEKDVVMDLAREIGAALRAAGFNVVMTRIADVDPSLDERAAVANAQRDAIFISLHVGSAGPAGTVRTYAYLFPSTSTLPLSPASFPGAPSPAPAIPPSNFVSWRQAQEQYVPQSRKLGDLIQVELAQKFKGSPEISAIAPVAVLRSVTAPAVAVEISNISAGQQVLENMAPDLAAGIARAVMAYKSVYPPGGK
jgi:N-acetylmuramoyl-L-alanine amidase